MVWPSSVFVCMPTDIGACELVERDFYIGFAIEGKH